MNTQNYEAVGLDTGYHRVKVAFSTGQFSFPSQVGAVPVNYGQADIGLASLPFHLIDPYHLLIGEAAQMQGVGQPDLSPRWFQSPRYFGLVAAALAGSSSLIDETYRVVMGLPVSYMAMKSELENLLSKQHTVQFKDKDRQRLTLKVTVVAQGVGALACGLIERDGTITRENAAKIEHPQDQPLRAVCDIGAGTSCFVLARGLSTASGGTKSISIGAWEIERVARELLTNQYGADLVGSMTPHALLRYLRVGGLKDAGAPIDTREIWSVARERVASQIIEHMHRAWSNEREIEEIIITGGGGMLLHKWIAREFHQAHMLDEIEPIFANAEGYLRIAQMLVARNA